MGGAGGLLVARARIPLQGLGVASADGADILIDFSGLALGTELTLWNNAAAPFNGAFADPSTAGRPDLAGLLPFPAVLLFRVLDGRRCGPPPPAGACTDFQAAGRRDLCGCGIRASGSWDA